MEQDTPDVVTITVSKKSFELSRHVLESGSLYFQDLLKKDTSETSFELPGLSSDVCEVLFSYLNNEELKLNDKDSFFFKSILETAELLGLISFPVDLQKWLDSNWWLMKSLKTAIELADMCSDRVGFIQRIIKDVLKVLLEVPDCPFDVSSFTYEVLIFVTRLEAFWEELNSMCDFYFNLEIFYDCIISWLLKNPATSAKVDSLVSTLRLRTIPQRYVNAVIDRNSATGSQETKDALLAIVTKHYDQALPDFATDIGIVSTNNTNGNITVNKLSKDMKEWEDFTFYKGITFEPRMYVMSEDHVYAFGCEEMQSLLSEDSPATVPAKYPEPLDIQEVCVHKNEIYVFGWNKRDLGLYKFDQVSNECCYLTNCPVDSNVVAISHKEDVYVFGNVLHKAETCKVSYIFKYIVSSNTFKRIAIINKASSSKGSDSFVSLGKTMMSVVGTHLYVITSSQQINVKTDLYISKMELKIEADENNACSNWISLPHSIGRYSTLVTAGKYNDGLLLAFRLHGSDDLRLALLNLSNMEIEPLRFLPLFTKDLDVKLEYICYLSQSETSNEDSTPIPNLAVPQKESNTDEGTQTEVNTPSYGEDPTNIPCSLERGNAYHPDEPIAEDSKSQDFTDIQIMSYNVLGDEGSPSLENMSSVVSNDMSILQNEDPTQSNPLEHIDQNEITNTHKGSVQNIVRHFEDQLSKRAVSDEVTKASNSEELSKIAHHDKNQSLIINFDLTTDMSHINESHTNQDTSNNRMVEIFPIAQNVNDSEMGSLDELSADNVSTPKTIEIAPAEPNNNSQITELIPSTQKGSDVVDCEINDETPPGPSFSGVNDVLEVQLLDTPEMHTLFHNVAEINNQMVHFESSDHNNESSESQEDGDYESFNLFSPDNGESINSEFSISNRSTMRAGGYEKPPQTQTNIEPIVEIRTSEQDTASKHITNEPVQVFGSNPSENMQGPDIPGDTRDREVETSPNRPFVFLVHDDKIDSNQTPSPSSTRMAEIFGSTSRNNSFKHSPETPNKKKSFKKKALNFATSYIL